MYFVKRIAIIASVAALLIAASALLILGPSLQQDIPGDVVRAPANDSGAMPVRFDKAINLTNNTQDSVYGQVVASGEMVYVVWQDSVAPTAGQYDYRNYDIYMAKSNDGGRTFADSTNLSNNPGFSEHPQAAAHNDMFYAVWADNTHGNKEVMFARSTDGGLNFEIETNLGNSPEDSYNQEIAVYGDSVYVVWLEEGDGKGQVMLKMSNDGGETFDSAMVISDKADLTTLPKVAADSRGVHVAWSVLEDDEGRGLYYSARMDGSEEPGEVVKLADGDEFGEPQVVADNSTVYVVAGGQDRYKVAGLFLAKSMDGGASFSSETIDLNGSFVNPLNVEAALDDDATLYVAGQAFVSDDEEILLLPLQTRSNTTDALGFVDLSDNEKTSECPSIAVSGDRVFVVWEDLSPGNHEILYAKGEKI